jgi:hypothetical protein
MGGIIQYPWGLFNVVGAWQTGGMDEQTIGRSLLAAFAEVPDPRRPPWSTPASAAPSGRRWSLKKTFGSTDGRPHSL